MHVTHIRQNPEARLVAGKPAMRRLPYVFAAATAVGFLLGHPNHAPPVEPELAMVLRFMAVMKAGIALGALGAARWRLRTPASPARQAALIAAVALMAASPGLIWGLVHVATGAALFLPGVLLFCLAAIGDSPGRTWWTASTLHVTRARP